MSRTTNIKYTIKSFLTNLGGNFIHPRKQKFNYIREWATTNYYWAARRPNLASTTLNELLNEKDYPTVEFAYSFDPNQLPPLDMYHYMSIIKYFQPNHVFEFGTYKGKTTYQTALAAPDSKIITIDLKEEENAWRSLPGFEFTIGEAFLDTSQASQITQLRADSKAFDFTPYIDKFDLIFIDAAHDYDSVVNDSNIAFQLLRPEGGVIIWDDYFSTHPGVKRAVEELSRNYPIKYLEQTRFAIMDTRTSF